MFPGFLVVQRTEPQTPLEIPFPGFDAYYRDPNHSTGAELVPLQRTFRTMYGANTIRSNFHQHSTGGQIVARLQIKNVWGVLLLDSIAESAVAVCGMILQVFEIDRETVAWEAGTDIFHPNPFLMLVSNYAEQEVDVIAGAVSIGQVEIGVIDRQQIPGDQASGFVTERLSVEGITAIHGRRCRLTMAADSDGNAVVIADGPAGTPRLDSSYSAYRWTIRDTRDTERKTRAFVKGGTTTILPRGIQAGFSPLGPTVPLNATFRIRIANVHAVGTGAHATNQEKHITHAYFEFPEEEWSETMLEALSAVEEAETSETTLGAWYWPEPGEFFVPSHPLTARHWRYPNVALWWRPLQLIGETDSRWRVLENLSESTINDVISSPLVPDSETPFHVQADTDEAPYDPPLLFDLSEDETMIYGVRIPAIPADVNGEGNGVGFYGHLNQGMEWPEIDQEVELLLVHNGNASETYPYHITGITTGELLRRLYDGEYSPRDPVTGDVISTNIRYDSLSLDAMIDPVHARITGPVDDLRAWAEEHVYAPTGWFPALDYDGRIAPLSQIPPDNLDGLALVDNDVAEARPDWNAGEIILNVLRFTYYRFYYAPDSDEAGADGLAVREIMYEYQDPASVKTHGENVKEYEALVSGAVGTETGEPGSIEETGRLQANDRRLYIFDRFRNGAQAVRVAGRRNALMFLRTGNWVILDLSWLPDYVTRRRGAQFVGQVIAIADLNCMWRELLVEEALPITES